MPNFLKNLHKNFLNVFPDKKRRRVVITLTLLTTTYLFFGLQHIGSFITADEHYWVEERIPDYWHAWSQGKWKKTFINDKPGVSLALLSGSAMLWHNTAIANCEESDSRYLHCDPKSTSRLYVSFRLPILLVNALFLIFIFFALQELLGYAAASLAVGGMVLSPHLLGMSQIVNPDSLLWSSGTAGLLAFLAYLKKERFFFALLAIGSLTLALLSKYTAIIIIFFLPIIILLSHFSEIPQKPFLRPKNFWVLLAISWLPFLFFVLFVPGIFSSPIRLLSFFTAGTGSLLPWACYGVLLLGVAAVTFLPIPEVYLKQIRRFLPWALRVLLWTFLLSIITLLIRRTLQPSWDIFATLPPTIKNLSNSKYYLSHYLSLSDITFLELSPLVYGLPLPSLLLGIYSLIVTSLQKKRSAQQSFVFILALLLIVNLFALGLGNVQAIPRYIILLYPAYAILAALGAKELWNALPKYFQTKWFQRVILCLVLLCSLGSVFGSKPYYANFSNLLLPKNSILTPSWGYGGYEAAQYLNALPDAKHLTIWSDYYGVCEFFVGRCLTAYSFDRTLAPQYYVLSYRGRERYMSRYQTWETKSGLSAYRYYDQSNPDFALFINRQKTNFVKVFKVRETAFSTEDSELKTPFTMPSFTLYAPPTRTCPIEQYGAKGDGVTMNTTAINTAISDCAKHGGGTVTVPAGTWLTGSIHLQSNVRLDLASGATLLGSTDFKDYLPVVFSRYEGLEYYNYAPLIFAENCQDIAITGQGVIDGRGATWWPWQTKAHHAVRRLYNMTLRDVPVQERVFGTIKDALRPPLIGFTNCSSVAITDVTLKNGPMWTVHLLYSQNALVRNVTIDTEGPNNDGIVIDSSRNVVIEHSTIYSSDDAIAIKSGADQDGRRVARPSENIVIRNTRVGQGNSGVAIGSEMSGDVRNVFVSDCIFDGTKRGLRFKSFSGRGGIVENVFADNITMRHIGQEAIIMDMNYDAKNIVTPRALALPTFRHFSFRNITVENAQQVLALVGLTEDSLSDLSFEHLVGQSKIGMALENAGQLTFTDLGVQSVLQPSISLHDIRDASFQNLRTPRHFLVTVHGTKTKNIRFDQTFPKSIIRTESTVAPGSVSNENTEKRVSFID